MKPADRQSKIAVVVGSVTNDVRILKLPKLKVKFLRGVRICHLWVYFMFIYLCDGCKVLHVEV